MLSRKAILNALGSIALSVVGSGVVIWITDFDWTQALLLFDEMIHARISVPLIILLPASTVLITFCAIAFLRLFRALRDNTEKSQDGDDATNAIFSDDALHIIEIVARLDVTEFKKEEMMSWQNGKIPRLRLDSAIEELISRGFLVESLNYVYGNSYYPTEKARQHMLLEGLI